MAGGRARKRWSRYRHVVGRYPNGWNDRRTDCTQDASRVGRSKRHPSMLRLKLMLVKLGELLLRELLLRELLLMLFDQPEQGGGHGGGYIIAVYG